MAIYSENFADYATGAEPDDWDLLTGTDNNGDEVEVNAEASGGQVFRLYNPNNSVPVWSPPDFDSENVALKTRVYPRGAVGGARIVRLWVYKPGSSPNGILLRVDTVAFIVSIVTSGGTTQVINLTTSHLLTENAWNIIELIANGAGGGGDPLQIKARCYAEGAPIPAYRTASDISTPSGSERRAGISIGNPSATAETDFDYITLLTDGDQPDIDTDENGQGQWDNIPQGTCYQITAQSPDESCDPQTIELTF